MSLVEEKLIIPEPDFISGLNSEQKKAVMNMNGPLLVLSGAGTGKTPTAVSTTYTSKPMWTTTIDGGTF